MQIVAVVKLKNGQIIPLSEREFPHHSLGIPLVKLLKW